MPRNPKRRIMRAFKINEISGVDDPAQEGARVAIMKRAEPQQASLFRDSDDTRKAASDLADLLTSEENGHQHGIRVRVYDGELMITVMYAMGTDNEHSHDHPIVRMPGGEYVLGTIAGHTHTIDQEAVNQVVLALMTKTAEGSVNSKGDNQMPETNTVENLQSQLDRTNAIIALNSEEREHFDKLEDDGLKNAFLEKHADERKAEIEAVKKAAQEADPVLYTTADGVELRKSDGEAVIALAKSNDAIRKENEALRQQRDQDALEKRAETELRYLPGDVKTRAAMLKAVEGIPDEAQREAALSSLKAQNDAMSKAFDAHGAGGQPDSGSPDSQLDKLAKNLAEKENISYEAAVSKVLTTDEGKALYEKTIN